MPPPPPPRKRPEATFADRAVARIGATAAGEVVTYGEVAREAGAPGAARAVGNLLAATGGLPWWRVVAANGRLAPGKETEQARRLRAEGVSIDPVTGRVAGMGGTTGRARQGRRLGTPQGPAASTIATSSSSLTGR